MRLFRAFAATALAGLVAADAVNDLENKGRVALDATIAKSTTCSNDKLQVRREWGDITPEARREWIDAVLCLMDTPSKLDPATYPGAKNRYDDFVVVHMNQTLSIHGTGNFLVWHRYYVYLWEKALQDECGYKGTQPYWDYGRWQADPLASPLFDGSDTSLGGNGAPRTLKEKREMRSKRQFGGGGFGGFGGGGNGGGCVTTGPFKDMVVTLGPMAAVVQPAPAANPQANGYGSNPRCLRRDITATLGQNYGKTTDIVNTITNYPTVVAFQNFLQGGQGVHGVGHFTVAGDPGGDFYISPNEPSFWLHHAMIDRIWTIWQSQDYENRRMAMQGGTRMMGGGPAQTLDDPVEMNVVGPTYAIRDLMSSVDGPGPFCYVYE
ncbi:related to tyrosinase [Cephalotrichum gorgonifer]|uniref:Related to tyrosinase n=1 Tax=Cephalotrichum gorgonifer TaxID=2041049 RepID=A0AAE8MT72_9PEZI|nr:related to tyrosinase [Cephalotrichum gorgonifer]